MTKHRHDGLRKICRCPRRQWPKCGHSYHFAFFHRGVPHRYSLSRLLGRPVTTYQAARAEADRLRAAIREGTFPPNPAAPVPEPVLETLETFAALWFERAVAQTKRSASSDAAMLRRICAFDLERPGGAVRFGAVPIGSVTEDDLEVFLGHLRAEGLAASTRNHYLQTFRSLSKWGLRKAYLTRSWFSPGSDLKREKPGKRNRRVTEAEEIQVLAVAKPHLYRLVVAAVETGCRLGELLALRWRDCSLTRREITIQTSKPGPGRLVPIARRLVAVLELARYDPAGRELPPEAYVFGDRVGRHVGSVKKAWQTAVLKAYGHQPKWVRPSGQLTPELRAIYLKIDLHLHDLRHEAASRWLEAGVPLHHVRALLGHSNIATTDTYLNAIGVELQKSIRHYDEVRTICKEFASGPPSEPRPSRKSERPAGDKSSVH